MLVTIQIHWTRQPNNNSQLGTTYTGVGKAFNTVSHLIEPLSTTYVQMLTDPAPVDQPQPAVGDVLYFECSPAPDCNRSTWYYAAGDTVTFTFEPNATSCGWTPPVTYPACTVGLSLGVNSTGGGDTITALVTGDQGALSFSRDGGATRQTSNVFGPLGPGTYTITVYDASSPGCQASATTTLSPTTAAPVPSAAPLPAVGFSRNPLALTIAATAPGRALLTEVFVEDYHGAGTYQRLVQRVRPTDAQGQAVLRLDEQLHGALVPALPDLALGLHARRRRDVIRRYFVRVAEIQPVTALPGPPYQAPACTVLRGGLGWAPARTGSFLHPLPPDWLSWRPAAEQLVGPDHVVLLAALVDAGEPSCTLRVRCFARGATAPSETLTYVLPLPGLQLGQVATPNLVQVQVPVPDGPPGAPTYRFDVALLVAGQVQTSVRRFRLDAGRLRRQFVFANSLGQWDTLSCPGPLSSKASVERTVATRWQAPDYDPQDGPESVAAVQLDARQTVSTGPLSPDVLEYLRELVLSTDVYEVGPLAQLRKIRLTTKDLLDYQDNAGQDGLAFEYSYCFDTTLYDPARLLRA